MKEFFDNVLSYLIAVIRLIFLVLIMLVNGLQQILFNRVEICNVGFSYLPLRKDRENISYINKLNLGNTDLVRPYPMPEDDFGDDDFEGDV